MIGQQHAVYSIFSSRHADSNNLFYVLCHMILCEARLSSRVCSIDDKGGIHDGSKGVDCTVSMGSIPCMYEEARFLIYGTR